MKTLSIRKTIQWTIAGILVMAGGVVVAGPVNPPPEPAGCADATCKEITYFITCDNKQPGAGGVLDRVDCVTCAGPGGRCENGTTKKCKPTQNPLFLALADVKEICQCSKAPALGSVEGSLVKQTGSFPKETSLKQNTCQ